MKREASFWKKSDNKQVICNLCNHKCKISNNRQGICNVRKNENGKLYTLIYNSVSSVAADPIEKKPLFHFYPGTNALSLGTIGCNFQCSYCQNYAISTADTNFSYLREISAEKSVNLAKEYNCQGIAYTYNEPTIWHEYCYDSAKLAKKAGLYTVYVSNGYMSKDSLKEISSVLDAINIDVKAFTDDFYKKLCKASLKPVLENCILAKKLGIHLELTYLIIPGYNDSAEELKSFCNWIVEKLDSKTPIHFSRFHPDFNLRDVYPTPMETMFNAYKIAKDSGIVFSYLGNVAHGDYENTICPNCGNICIERVGYEIYLKGVKNNKCAKCSADLNISIK